MTRSHSVCVKRWNNGELAPTAFFCCRGLGRSFARKLESGPCRAAGEKFIENSFRQIRYSSKMKLKLKSNTQRAQYSRKVLIEKRVQRAAAGGWAEGIAGCFASAK